jgi:hypothetical protein
VAARLNAPALEETLLRRLRVRAMTGGLLDDPELIAAAATDAGLEPETLERWCGSEAVAAELAADVRASREPSAAARALDHKLGGPRDGRRYTAPSYELARDEATFSLPGFNPVEAYEAAIANLAPELVRRPRPEHVEELLEWATEPLATAEVVAVMQQPEPQVRAALAGAATPIPAGADCYWTLGA